MLTGHFYYIRDEYFRDFQDEKLMSNGVSYSESMNNFIKVRGRCVPSSFCMRKIAFDFLAEIQYYVSRIVCLERLVSYESTKIHF